MSDAVARTGLGMTDRTVVGIREALAGQTRWRSPFLFAGPAVIASIPVYPALDAQCSRCYGIVNRLQMSAKAGSSAKAELHFAAKALQ